MYSRRRTDKIQLFYNVRFIVFIRVEYVNQYLFLSSVCKPTELTSSVKYNVEINKPKENSLNM